MTDSSTPSTGHAGSPSARGDALVVFGLTGDLGDKKLLPALIELEAAGRLPRTVIAVGHSDRSDDDVRAMLVEAADSNDQREVAGRIPVRYLAGDANDDDTYARLTAMLEESSVTELPVVYAALPPDLFGAVAAGVGRLGDSARLVVEKPFGSDSGSARALHREITAHIPAERLFLVDHFLAKSAVENLMAVRRANPWLDASLRGGSVERVEVTMTESFGVDGRGSFYDSVGALRDVVQNHLLALLSMMAMEPAPIGDHAAHAEARRELLASIRPLDPDDVTLGQFDRYRLEEGVDADSNTETYVHAWLFVDNDRWRGVPFKVQTGKCLRATRTEVTAVFAKPEDVDVAGRLRFCVRPDSEITLDLTVLDPHTHALTSTTLTACGPSGHGSLSDYAVMFDGALDGDRRHFAAIDDVVASWHVVEPVLDLGRSPVVYEPGSDGPLAS